MHTRTIQKYQQYLTSVVGKNCTTCEVRKVPDRDDIGVKVSACDTSYLFSFNVVSLSSSCNMNLSQCKSTNMKSCFFIMFIGIFRSCSTLTEYMHYPHNEILSLIISSNFSCYDHFEPLFDVHFVVTKVFFSTGNFRPYPSEWISSKHSQAGFRLPSVLSQSTAVQADATCCELGMRLVVPASEQELICLSTAYKGTHNSIPY